MKSLPSMPGSMTVVLAICLSMVLWAQTPEDHVHVGSHNVMPFDLSKTLHIFRMTELGGVESVVIREPGSKEQLTLVQAHLRHEATEFQKGNYWDPAALHGATMPGLKDLQEGATHIKVSYADLPNGAAITFETANLHLLTAIHRWFGAQLSEHGADARAE
jgi:hypothetical protein